MKNIFTLLALLSTGIALAQESDLKSADLNYGTLKFYDEAIPYYKAALKKDPDNSVAHARLADCYYYTNDLKSASTEFAAAFRLESNLDSKFIFHYAATLHSLGQLAESQTWYQRYQTFNITAGKHYYNAISTIPTIPKSAFSVKNETALNSEASDFAPTLFGSTLIFGSARKTALVQIAKSKIKQSKKDLLDEAVTQLYAAECKSDGSLAFKNSLRGDLTLYNQSPVAYSADGKMIAYCNHTFRDGVRPIPDTDEKMALYTAQVDKIGSWNVENPFEYNNSEFIVGQPSLSNDGKIMYFTANFDGGYGGFDIYYCHQQGLRWSTPQNAGPKINSQGNEVTPFLTADGKTLYFASDWHDGLGGYDLFQVDATSSNPTIINLGIGINSGYDDLYLIADGKGSFFFTSNRLGGKGNLDIYSAHPAATKVVAATKEKEKEKVAEYSINPVNVKPKNLTKNYIGQVLETKGSAPVSGVIIRAVRVGATAKELPVESFTDENGEFSMALLPDQTYNTIFSSKGYTDILKEFKPISDNPQLGKFHLDRSSTSIEYISDDSPRFPPKTTAPSSNKTVEKAADNLSAPLATPTESNAKKAPEDIKLPEHGYVIRLGAFKSPDQEKLAIAQAEGNILKESKTEKGVHIYDLGIFLEEAQAQKVLAKIKPTFPQAYVRVRDFTATSVTAKMAESVKIVYPTESIAETPVAKQLPPDLVARGGNPIETPVVKEGDKKSNKLDINSGTPKETVLNLPPTEETSSLAATVVEPEIFFKVQLAVVKTVKEEAFEDLKDISSIETMTGPQGMTYYFLGNYTDLNEAKKAQQKAVAKGVKEAFIVGFKDGKRVPLTSIIR